MNSKHCEKCHGPMVFAGSFASGRLECPRCKNEAWMQEVDANIKALNQAKQLSDEEQEDNKGLGSYMVYDPARVGDDWTSLKHMLTVGVPKHWITRADGCWVDAPGEPYRHSEVEQLRAELEAERERNRQLMSQLVNPAIRTAMMEARPQIIMPKQDAELLAQVVKLQQEVARLKHSAEYYRDLADSRLDRIHREDKS